MRIEMKSVETFLNDKAAMAVKMTIMFFLFVEKWVEKSFFLLLQRQKIQQCSFACLGDLALIWAVACDWQKTECSQGGTDGDGTKC